jgi:hypothetical protein
VTSKRAGQVWCAFYIGTGKPQPFTFFSCLVPIFNVDVLDDSILRSDRAHAHVRTLAARHPRTKFVSIVGDKCIPNLPESRVPMFIVYRKGQIVTQITAWGLGPERTLEGGSSVAIVI